MLMATTMTMVESGQRHVGGRGRGDQDDGQQHQRMQDAGDGAPAGTDIGRGAGDGAGGGETAEQWAVMLARPCAISS